MSLVELKSGGVNPLSRYDIRGEDPAIVLNNMDAATDWLARHAIAYDGPLPFVAGLMGSIDYEGRAWLMAPRRVRLWDHLDKRGWVVQVEYGSQVIWKEVESSTPPPLRGTSPYKGEVCWTPAISKSHYLACVKKVLHHIREGDIYQANFSQTFTAPFAGDPYAFWQSLFARNPAPFFAYIHDGTQQLLCTSPELLLRQRGRHVESRPIKGTRPRGHSPEEDAQQLSELLSSVKEGAELAMIVDLVRNDLHRICTVGSVEVAQHRMIEAYTNVFHQISVVTGKLPAPATCMAALQVLFPGGSITGCPKIRSMEIIQELEGRPRGIYTGSIGYASLHGTQDWNIAIRTAVVRDKTISLAVGGGIVADSDPEKEYEETLHKAATFFSLPSKSMGLKSSNQLR